MDRNTAERRIIELRTVIEENSRRYYIDNSPLISDFEFDSLMRELSDLEELYPEFRSSDSPTNKVGSDIDTQSSSRFKQVAHKYPMLSLSNTYSISEVEEFAARASKSIEGSFNYCCELKFDGTSIGLEYKNGVLSRALTRGDGTRGDDVTANVLQIKNIPHKLTGKGWPEEFEIRGEILLPYESFDALNKEREQEEEPPFANPRNAASGSLKLLDPKEVGRRGLECTLYHIPGGLPDVLTHDDALAKASSWGLPVSDSRRVCRTIEEVEEFINYWDTERKYLPVATDGIVIKINELPLQQVLGYTAKSPRWACAYKFKAEQALTEVLSIDYQVGRTGAVTPVANLAPVPLSGTIVKRATLNNAEQMALLDIRIGDFVYVEKGGEIIPKIISVELSKRKADSARPVFPSVCPDCGTPLIKTEDEAKHFCPNTDGCPTQIKGKLLHFLSRKAMNVIAGEATIEQLYNKGLVRCPADFYDLGKDELLSLEGWKEKAAKRFMDSLKKSKEVSFERVLFALGIRYVGEQTAKELARHFGSIDKLREASLDDLLAVADVGDVIAGSVDKYLHDERHIAEIERLKAKGLQFSIKQEINAGDALKGKIIVISGNFSISRDEMKALIEANGGKNSSAISAKTTWLLAGSKAGPAKLKEAQKLGVPVISEETFMKQLPSRTDFAPEMEEDDEPNLFSGLL